MTDIFIFFSTDSSRFHPEERAGGEKVSLDEGWRSLRKETELENFPDFCVDFCCKGDEGLTCSSLKTLWAQSEPLLPTERNCLSADNPTCLQIIHFLFPTHAPEKGISP